MSVPLRTSLWCTLLILLVSTIPVQAQDSKRPEPESAVPLELVAGTVGGAGFGLAGAYLAAAACLAQAEGWEGFACIGFAVLGYLIGVPVGSTVGVNIAGLLFGVHGNVLLSALGAIGGEVAAIGFAALIVGVADGLPESVNIAMFLAVIPFASSAGATLGFNVGARAAPLPTNEAVLWTGHHQPVP